jgi:hypothetical protein
MSCNTFAPAAIVVASIACCSVAPAATRRQCRVVKGLLDARLRGHDKGGRRGLARRGLKLAYWPPA